MCWPIVASLAVTVQGGGGLGLTAAASLAFVLSKPPRELRLLAPLVLVLGGLAVSRLTAVPMIALVAPAALVEVVPAVRASPGKLLATARSAGVLVAGAFLASWWWLRDQKGVFLFASLPEWITDSSGWKLVVTVAGLSLVNSVAEEAVWRRAIPTVVGAVVGPPTGVVVASVSFGIMHWHAVPFGLAGVVMTTAFGLAAHAANRHAGSIVPGVAAHFAADMVLLTWLLG